MEGMSMKKTYWGVETEVSDNDRVRARIFRRERVAKPQNTGRRVAVDVYEEWFCSEEEAKRYLETFAHESDAGAEEDIRIGNRTDLLRYAKKMTALVAEAEAIGAAVLDAIEREAV
jgi:hypothetical protein